MKSILIFKNKNIKDLINKLGFLKNKWTKQTHLSANLSHLN